MKSVKSVRDLPTQTPQQKLLQALNLYHSAMELKIAALKQFHPELSEAEIKEKAKRIFFNAK